MTTFSEMETAVRTRWNTNIKIPKSLPTAYENETFEAPEDELWARVSILNADSNQRTMGDPGNNNFFNPAVVVMNLFTPLDTGMKVLTDLADEIVPFFRSQTVDGVQYRTPSIVKVGRRGKYWQVNVTVPCQSQDLG